MTHFRTARLTVSPLTGPAELGAGLPQLATPAVTQHLPPELHAAAHPTPEAWLARLMSRSTVLKVQATEAPEPTEKTEPTAGPALGLLTLHSPSDTEVMLGYLFAEPAWGQGFATELVTGWLAHRKAQGWPGTIGTGTIWAGVAAQNAASARVLEKAGFELAEPGLYRLDCGPLDQS